MVPLWAVAKMEIHRASAGPWIHLAQHRGSRRPRKKSRSAKAEGGGACSTAQTSRFLQKRGGCKVEQISQKLMVSMHGVMQARFKKGNQGRWEVWDREHLQQHP